MHLARAKVIKAKEVTRAQREVLCEACWEFSVTEGEKAILKGQHKKRGQAGVPEGGTPGEERPNPTTMEER